MTRVLVDSDFYAYACGGATQRTRYDVGAHLPDGGVQEVILDSSEEVKAWKAEEWPEGTEFTVGKIVEPEPESHAIHLVKRSLNAIEKAMDNAGIKFERLELVMTGEGNFRESVATIKGYKANRDRAERPVHYAAIRRYLSRAWHATTVTGYEADDALAMAAHVDPTVIIVSQDKDLKTVAGRHYNARTKKWATITEEEARAFFYRQLVTGDTVDNIGGCYRAGPKAAEVITADMPESEMYGRVLAMYEASLGKSGCPYVDMGAYNALLENARLLHLLRHTGDVWHPPVE